MHSSLESLPLVRLQFELESLETLEVSPYKGDLLRMALLWWLSEFWCPEESRCREGCRRPDECMFGRLCQPCLNPAWPSDLRRLIGDTPPPAYTLWDFRDRRTHIFQGAPWAFEMTWTGALAIQQIPAIVAAVQRGAELGMGRMRWRNRLIQVTAWTPDDHPPHILATTEPHQGVETLIWRAERVEDVVFGYSEALRWAETWTRPVRALRIDYVSPMKLKERGEWVMEPHFSAIARALTRRLRILSELYGGGEWPHEEYGPLLDLGDAVILEHHETHWMNYSRYSQQSGNYEIEGFVGPAWYAAEDFRPLLPVLWLGQWLHLGKGYVLGNGRYQLQVSG